MHEIRIEHNLSSLLYLTLFFIFVSNIYTGRENSNFKIKKICAESKHQVDIEVQYLL